MLHQKIFNKLVINRCQNIFKQQTFCQKKEKIIINACQHVLKKTIDFETDFGIDSGQIFYKF